MNSDQTKGQWNQLKGKAKQIWSDLTDDDFKKAEGSADELYGIIQQKFGDTKETIKKKINEIQMS